MVIALVVLGAALAAAPARADDLYTVHTCRGPDGKPASVDRWSFHGAAVERSSNCARGGDIAAGPTSAPYADQQAYGWQFDAPPATRIVAWMLYRTVQVPKGDTWAWNWNLFRDEPIFERRHLVENCYSFSTSCRGFGDGRVSQAARVGEANVDLARVIGNIDCRPAACPGGSGSSIRIHRGDFVLRDTIDPMLVGTPSGDLLDTTKPVTGVQGASFAAADRGGGVYLATIEVDGKAVATEVVDSNGGLCRRPFRAAVPCRTTANGSISFDTGKLEDGPHSLRLIVTDPTETNAATYGPVRITTLNRTPKCDPAQRPSVTPVKARFRGTKRRSIKRRSGRSTVAGRIEGTGPGAVVYLIAREQRSGARSRFAGTALTRAGGRFALRVPRGVSRRLRAAYRTRPGAGRLACSRGLDIGVPARATLTVRPRQVAPGGLMRMTGRLLGGHVPRRGKLIDIQGYSGGKWRPVTDARTNGRGRFRAGYRFVSRVRPGASFRIRVRVQPEASYPFDLGYSKSVRVRIAGG